MLSRQSMLSHSFYSFFFLPFTYAELPPYIRLCAKHTRYKDGCDIFLTIKNVMRKGQTISVKVSQVENFGLGRVVTAKKE